jgi:hypothetical protein
MKLAKTNVETSRMMCEAYCNETSSKTMIYEWHKHFQSERTSTYDDEMTDRPSSSRNNSLIAQVKDIVCVNCQRTVWKPVEETGIFTGSCHTILI